MLPNYTPIPLDILNRASADDYGYRAMTSGFVCHHCAQATGDHHYACPQAIAERQRKRSVLRSKQHQHIELAEV